VATAFLIFNVVACIAIILSANAVESSVKHLSKRWFDREIKIPTWSAYAGCVVALLSGYALAAEIFDFPKLKIPSLTGEAPLLTHPSLPKQFPESDPPVVISTTPPRTVSAPAPVPPLPSPAPAAALRPDSEKFQSVAGVDILTRERERALKPTDTFRECEGCPEMIVVPSGSYTMGSGQEQGSERYEGPSRKVTIARPFAVGRFAVTFNEWDSCVRDGGCNAYRPSDEGWGRDRRPVINVNWNDTQNYLIWLRRKTGKAYRLLSEAEREYVTRAGTATPFWFGPTISTREANYDGNYVYWNGAKNVQRNMTLPVDSFQPNPWGLYQVHGNVWEWTQDCYKENYVGAPNNGEPATGGDCNDRVLRGGSFFDDPKKLRSASRQILTPITTRTNRFGFRVARSIGF